MIGSRERNFRMNDPEQDMQERGWFSGMILGLFALVIWVQLQWEKLTGRK